MLIYNTLEYLKTLDVSKPQGFVYKAFKNKKILEVEIEALKEIEPKIYKDFQNKANEVLIKYCKKDENNIPMTANNSGLYQDLLFEEGKRDLANAEINELAKTVDNKAMIDEQTQYNNILDEEIEVELLKFSSADLFDGIREVDLENLDKIVD